MQQSSRRRRVSFSRGPAAVHGAVLLLLLHQLGAGLSAAAVGEPSSTPIPWPGTGGGGGGEMEEGDVGSLVDRSAQIIKQQDAEEGERWEETAWSPVTSDNEKDKSLCKKPSPPENGYIKGDNYNDGGVVRIFCEAGYTLHGPSKLTCVPVPHPGAPGVWLPEDEYHCLPSEPTVVEIRTLDRRGNRPGPSYTVLNVNVHDAGKHHSIDRQISHENVKCPKPTAPQHGSLEETDHSLYSTVHVNCDEGYNLIGPDHITCLPVPDPFHHVGIWEPQQMPSCHARPQFSLPLVLFQELSSEKDTHQQSAHRKTDTLPDTSRVEGLPSLCSLPKVVGPCRASIPRFYFDSTQQECLPFTYGGCHGNDNNFETFSDCRASCR